MSLERWVGLYREKLKSFNQGTDKVSSGLIKVYSEYLRENSLKVVKQIPQSQSGSNCTRTRDSWR